MMTDPGGNRERIGYVFDKRAVVFNGLATQASEPRVKKGTEYLAEISWWRRPYLASFSAGNFDFVVFTTHVRWGDNEAARIRELETLADWIEAKRKEKTTVDKDLIVMGDFNIPARDDPFFRAITKHGLQIPKGLLKTGFGSNLEKNKRYDQILHYPTYDNFCNSGGVLDFFIHEAGIAELFPAGMTKEKFTYQLSDHLPLWIQIGTDIDGQELTQLIRG
jgi:endonuclease/exonuclease/phosphatase family metal-dependent hydrolase